MTDSTGNPTAKLQTKTKGKQEVMKANVTTADVERLKETFLPDRFRFDEAIRLALDLPYPEPEPEPQDIVRRFMQKLNVMKNGLLNLLPGRRTHILYPEELNINIGPNWITHGPSVHRAGEGGVR